MTLPFRRRHNDAEASHERARSIMATGFLEPTEPADDAWLETHLAGCHQCRTELVAFQADRELLRMLRDSTPEPPRDLWARTAASIEREASHHGRPARPVAGRRVGRLPLGVMSGVLVILVVIGTSLVPPSGPPILPPTTAGPSDVAIATPRPEATPLTVTANAVTWVQARADGTYQLVSADLDEVCTADPNACAPIEDEVTTRLTLRSEPEQVVLSRDQEQLVVVSVASETGSDVIIVDVPAPLPTDGATPEPTATPVTTPTPEPTLPPGDTPPPSIPPTASPDPDGGRSILSGVVVVGDAAYSPDGQWLAFSARPVDGTSGPDLYTWRVGDPGGALAATSDHRTFFAGWLGPQILASRVEPASSIDPNASPGPSAEPTTQPEATAKPAKTQGPGGPRNSPSPVASFDPSASAPPDPGASPDASAAPVEDRSISFLYDPATETVIDLAGQDIWRPVVDPASRSIVYWSGTLVPDADGTGWSMGTGRLVIDGWIDPALPTPSATFDPSSLPTIAPTPSASADPLASPLPTPPPGPAGSPRTLVEGPIADFEASFDPSGSLLAVWSLDPANPTFGTLRLIAIDAETGAVRDDVDPLPGVAALRGFSIGEGRLAWVTPPGQDGDASHVQVLAWEGDEFGHVRSIAADRFVVVR